MTSRSTASSRTEGQGPEAPDPSDADAVSGGSTEPSAETTLHDAERRAFFFKFGKEAVTAVGQAVGMADIVSRTSSGVAATLLGLAPGETTTPRREFTRSRYRPVVSRTTSPDAEDHFRSAYRLADGELILLDQRGVPERLDEVTAKRGSDVAYYLRLGVSRGGPVMAQLAAYGLALTAAERATHDPAARETELTRTGRALAEARPSARLLTWAVQQMSTVRAALDDSASGSEMALALRHEADAIALGFQTANATISTAIADVLPRPAERPLTVLIHGSQGALAGGLVGTGLAALRHLLDEGRELRVFVTEGRPFMDGARLTGWELRQAGIQHKVIADGAAAWLFEREIVDAVLISAEWIAANGDVGAVIGARGLAQQAAAARVDRGTEGPMMVVHGVSGVIDLATPDAAAIPVELRPARDLSAYLADVPIRASDALVPATDVIPAALVGALVTERGTLNSVSRDTIAALVPEEGAG